MSEITCFNCGTPTAVPFKVKLEDAEIKFCPSCFTVARKAAPFTITLLSADKQYLQLRDHRNRERDKMEADHLRGSVKHLDASLELYERKMGTEYCAVLYHNHQHHG